MKKKNYEKVPSLCVRVYRIKVVMMCMVDGSLTMREGVSLALSSELDKILFPHYA